MIRHLITHRLPEFAGLSAEARNVVWRSCVLPLLWCWSTAVTKVMLLAATIGMGWYLGMLATIFGTVILFAMAWIIDDLHDVVLVMAGRTRIRRYVADHRTELLEAVQPGGPANGSQPIRSETNGTSGTAGSRR